MQGIQQLMALGRQGAVGVSQIGSNFVQRVLDRFYGPPQLGSVRAARHSAERCFDGLELPASLPAVSSAPLPAISEDHPVAVPADPNAGLQMAERVRTARLIGRHGVNYGSMWLYLYPAQGIARRVLKITDPHLAKALKSRHFRFGDVPFDPVIGSTPLFDALYVECKQVLNGRRLRVREVAPEKAGPSHAATPGAEGIAKTPAPAVNDGASVATGILQGETIQGVVTSAGRCVRTGPDGGSYTTFGLTLNDGQRDVSLFGNELERLSAELRVRPGDRVKVVFLGKAMTTVPGKSGPAFRNMYQLERVGAR